MRSAAVAALLLLAVPVGPRLETVEAPPPRGLAPGVAARLRGSAFRVEDAALRLVVHLAEVERGAEPPPGAFAAIGPGSLAGVLVLERPWRDYRDLEVPAGVYTLRYAVRPILKDHAGVSPYRDFLLLVPAALDDGRERDADAWRSASRGLTSPTHPAVLALVPTPPAAAARLTHEGDALVLAPPGRPFALVLVGHAALDQI
jgi:hypothetical protein